MAEKKVQKKKKKWVNMVAPKIFRDISLGECPVYDENNVVGRKIKVNLMTLTRDPKKQNINVTFNVLKVESGIGVTEIYGYEMVPSSIKRLIKRRRNKITDSFVCKTKDAKVVRIKPLIVTNGSVAKSVLTEIRKKVRYTLGTKLASHNFSEFIGELFTGKINKMKSELKTIYPVRTFEIRNIRIETRKVAPIKPDDYKSLRRKVEKNVSIAEEENL